MISHSLVTSRPPSDRLEAPLTGQYPSERQHPADEARDVGLACAGDQDAFERLYRANVSRIHGVARRMAGFEAADELTQDVFIRAWQKLGSFRGESRFHTWLYRLAINAIIESRRAFARRAMLQTSDEEAVLNARFDAADGVLSLDLSAAVDRLPEGARQVFVLHDVEGYKHQEIGDLMGIATGTSKAQLHRARMLLRKHLSARREVTGS